MNKCRKQAGRPHHCRRIQNEPDITMFRPRGIDWHDLDQVQLTVDELEAVRLADLEGLYQAEAADKMKVSRPTFGRIITSAHRKIADVLVNGKALKISGGVFMSRQNTKGMGAGGFCICPKCKEKIPHRQGFPCQEESCPKCRTRMLREGSYHHDLLKQKQNKEN